MSIRDRFVQVFSPPSVQEPDQQRKVNIVYGVLITLQIAILLGIPLAYRFGKLNDVAVVVIGSALVGILFFIFKHGNLYIPSVGAPLVLLGVITFVMINGWGAYDASVFAFAGLVTLSALLLGEDWPGLYWGYVLLCIAAFAGVYYLGINGLTDAPDALRGRMTVDRVILFGFYMVTTAALLRVLMNNYLRIIDRERQMQKQLSALNETLEIRVKERTRDLEKARVEAEQANQIKSQFLAAMSHELRTPLNAIINLSDLMHHGYMGEINVEQKESSGVVVSSARHLLSLINDVLDISKIESGSLQLFLEDNVDVSAELKTVQQTALSLLKDRPVEFRLKLPSDFPTMRVDRLRLRQILLNVVSNACKFTEEGFIEVRAHHLDSVIRFEVEDTGPGIKVSDQMAVFESFRQTGAGLRSGKGTGLGMPIARRLTEAHGGKLWFESVLGKGATFFVELPRHAEPSEADHREVL